LAFSCFRAPSLNPWASGVAGHVPSTVPADPHAPGPFAFADEARVAGLLKAAGWRDAAAVPLDFEYVAGTGDDPILDAVGFFLRIGPTAAAIRQLDGADRQLLIDALHAFVATYHAEGRVVFRAAAWIWSATA
jgi:hypothetical protein